MRLILLLLVSAAAAPRASAQPAAQPATQMCGAPGVYDAWSAGQRLRALTDAPALPARGPYESTAEWDARTDVLRADARRRALDGLGPTHALRVGGRVTPRYDADAERLWFGADDAVPPTVVQFPETMRVSDAANGQFWQTPEPVPSLFGTSLMGSDLELGWGPPSMRMSRTRARLLDPLQNLACVFYVFKVFDEDWPVVGLDRLELVSVDRTGVPSVWSWTFHDDGSVGGEMEADSMETMMEGEAMWADSTSMM